MKLSPITKRDLKNVGQNIWDAVALMERDYGGQLTHDSGHGQDSDEQATTWIFTFPSFGDAQIAVPMNRQKLSLLMRSHTLDGRALEQIVGGIAKIEKKYSNPERGVASSVLGSRAPFLNPSPGNPLLRVNPSQTMVGALLSLYFGQPAIHNAIANVPHNDTSLHASSQERLNIKRIVTADQLQRQLDRNAETGATGELIAVLDEMDRLRMCGCLEPEKFVSRIALDDVGRGYDIASTWLSETRCIEVKSTTVAGSAFFLTENEREVMTALGDNAWLYRVLVGIDGSGMVTARLRNPMRVISPEQLVPVVWRVAGDALKAADDLSRSS